MCINHACVDKTIYQVGQKYTFEKQVLFHELNKDTITNPYLNAHKYYYYIFVAVLSQNQQNDSLMQLENTKNINFLFFTLGNSVFSRIY